MRVEQRHVYYKNKQATIRVFSWPLLSLEGVHIHGVMYSEFEKSPFDVIDEPECSKNEPCKIGTPGRVARARGRNAGYFAAKLKVEIYNGFADDFRTMVDGPSALAEAMRETGEILPGLSLTLGDVGFYNAKR